MAEAKIVTLQNESGEAIAPRTGATAVSTASGESVESALASKIGKSGGSIIGYLTLANQVPLYFNKADNKEANSLALFMGSDGTFSIVRLVDENWASVPIAISNDGISYVNAPNRSTACMRNIVVRTSGQANVATDAIIMDRK